MNLKLLLTYDGTDFHGWQYQPNRRTVSGVLMSVFDRLIDGEYKLIGVGRTDSGVHALGYVANLLIYGRLRVKVEDLKYKLNRMLPEDVYVRDVSPVPEGFHARYSAISKTYRYLFGGGYDPLMRRRVWFVRRPPSPSKVAPKMKVLLGRHDFHPFAADERENGVCTLYDIRFGCKGGYVFMDVRGDRFLRKMVRFLASLAVMLEEGRVTVEEVEESLRTGRRIKALTPAPPWGLYLLRVEYPEGY